MKSLLSFSREFLAPILNTLRQNDPGVFSGNVSEQLQCKQGMLNEIFACRAWIHNRGSHAGTSVVDA